MSNFILFASIGASVIISYFVSKNQVKRCRYYRIEQQKAANRKKTMQFWQDEVRKHTFNSDVKWDSLAEMVDP